MNQIPALLLLALLAGDTENLLFPVTGRFVQSPAQIVQSPAQAREVYFVAFGASWCAPCKRWQNSELPQLRAAGWRVRLIDMEREPTWNARYNVTAVPVFVMLDLNTRETVGGPWRGFTAASVLISAAEQYCEK